MILEGQRLGEFEIIERIGQGGMGIVYKARQTSLDRLVALKTLQGPLAENAEYIARFRQEAKAAAGLHHPNLVQVYSAGENEGLHWFAMEYIKGESAKDRLQRKGRLKPLEAIAIVIHVAAALEYGWNKAALIHRDVKPDNIFLSDEGEVRLGDLGLAKSIGQAQHLTTTGVSMGTPHYISPEQVEGTKNIDFRTDIYSLGCTLYHLLSGHPPYEGGNAVGIMMKHGNAPTPDVRSVWPECPPELALVVMKMMLKAPESRPQSYAELTAQLRRVYDLLSAPDRRPKGATTAPLAVVGAAGGGTVSPRSGPCPPRLGALAHQQVIGPAKTRKSKAPLFTGLAAIVVALAGGAYYFVQTQSHKAAGKVGTPDTAGDSGRTRSVVSQTSAGESGGRLGADTAGAGPPNAPSKQAPSPTDSAPTKATKDAPVINTLGMKFVPVPIGGGPTAGQRVLFSIWDTRVQDYAAYAAANPQVDSEWKTAISVKYRSRNVFDGLPVGHEPDYPVVKVNWEDAQAFCRWLTQKEQADGKLPKGVAYRLPTDEEWSWAVGLLSEVGSTPAEKSGKNNVDFPWGKDFPPTKKVGNYADESLVRALRGQSPNWLRPDLPGYTDGFATTSPVGAFPANAYGLYDMGGNVSQWCEDWYDGEHLCRVLRGASWLYGDRRSLLSSFRILTMSKYPTYRDYDTGFRCVLDPGPSAAPAVPQSTPPPTVSAPPAPPSPVPATPVASTPVTPRPAPSATFGAADHPESAKSASLLRATKESPLVNSLGQQFVPVPGTKVLFCRTDVRVRDFRQYANATRYEQAGGAFVLKVKTETTRGGGYVHVITTTTWELDSSASWEKPGFEQTDDHPVVCVSWKEAHDFCTWLSKQEGRTYRLPTDAEWSAAVGVGKYPWGTNEWPPPKGAGNYLDDAYIKSIPGTGGPQVPGNDGYARTSPVGSFRENWLGLFDMGGNVCQACEDEYKASMNDAETLKEFPFSKNETSSDGTRFRVMRGESWGRGTEIHLRSSYRFNVHPTFRIDTHGFRCVLVGSPVTNEPTASPAAGLAHLSTPTSITPPATIAPAATPSMKKAGDSLLRFDGLYRSEVENANTAYQNTSYLRFYADGTVINVSSSGTPEQVKSWFVKGHANVPQAPYQLAGNDLHFTIQNGRVTVEYNGKIGADGRLQLHTKSYFNQHEADKTYSFVAE